ncbi:MAG TPA: regulatory iron-sulfur-containing complex subunit RicT [Victivallales bacterium]|nr:regulatory iron-sulfur-containing complex subunit RicT [Victivallales bacterium]HPO90299.1 regulatory iron-sulfur-containing complex subunit RicT [Victivallales bacterium]HRU00585.1 regulatory iron-sulfur-containing complex subunit RicT [Victivallales bacterium]
MKMENQDNASQKIELPNQPDKEADKDLKDTPNSNLFCEIKLDTGVKYYAILPLNINIREKEFCVIRKERLLDYGQLVKIFPVGYLPKIKQPIDDNFPVIERKATMQDQGKANENQMRAKSAMRTAIQYIQNLNLPMKLLNAHYTLDMKLVTFQFTAPGRVDFRELVKQLSHGLNTRIELRQIGVRDEAALFGGFGVCGQCLCCARYIREFASINVRMAKEQDLPLNPNNISGNCNRLKCCLKYEHEGYLEMEKGMPRIGSLCDCGEGRGKIIDRNLLTRKVSIQLDDTGKVIIYPVDEVRVVYLEKYKLPPETDISDPYAGLDEEAKKALKSLEE